MMFTDESSIEMDEEYDPTNVQTTSHSQRKTLMVRGAIAHGKRWPLV